MASLPASSSRRPDWARIRPLLLLAMATALALNGTWMFVAPIQWFAAVDGVADTGPANPHFVRDVGITYFCAAAALALALRLRRAERPLLALALLFLALHAGLHLWDVAAGRLPAAHLLSDLPGVFLPPIILAFLIPGAGQPEDARGESR